MDQLPIEILSKILALASFDNATTGCSLALTSKWLGNVADSIRFEAVSVCGTSQITQFADMLDSFPDRIAGKIRHLFVSGVSRRQASKQRQKADLEMRKVAVTYELIAPDDDQGEECEDMDEDIKEIVYQELHLIYAAFHRIMHHASPSIYTLFVTSPSNVLQTFPLSAMPYLTYFSLTSAFDSFADTQTFPSLKRFHTDFVPITPSESPINLRTLSPALEELCVINLRRPNNKFLDSISDHAYSVEAGNKGGDSTSELTFPDTMERIFLHPSPPPYNARCGTPYQFHCHFMRKLIECVKSLAESEHRRAGFRVVLLEWPTVYLWHEGRCSGLRYLFDDARRDWTDVLLGEGKGCWNDANRASADSLAEYDLQDHRDHQDDEE